MVETNTGRFSESIGAIKGLVAKLASLHDIELKEVEFRTSGLKATEDASFAAERDRSESATSSLKTEEEVLAAIDERVASQCESGLWKQVQDSLKAQHQRDERRVWRQIVAAIRVNDEAEASRLAKAAGIPTEFLKS